MSVNRHPNTQGVTIKQWRYTATGGETTLSGTDGFSQSLTYTPGAEEVFVNGVLLVRGTDYTASTGTTVVLNNALVAGDIATVSAPSVFNVANSIPSSTVTAKGDLLVANGSASLTNLAVGADGTTLVANSSAGGGVSWAGPQFVAGRNKIINGDFGIWQRGTSFSNPATGTYTADRFAVNFDGSGAARTISQQAFTPGSAPVAGYEGTYFARFNQGTAGSGATYNNFQQKIEDVRILAGQTATVSFWAKADSTRTVGVAYYQYFGSGGSSDVIGSTNNVSVTTSWARYSVTLSIPSVSGKTIGSGSFLIIELQQPLNTTFTIDYWGVQVEAGSVATPFTTATGTVQGELAACQRYYWRTANNGGAYQMIGRATAFSGTQADLFLSLPVTMRTSYATIDYNSIALTPYAGTGTIAVTAVTAQTSDGQLSNVRLTVGSGLSAGALYTVLYNGNSSAYLGLGAEL